MKNTFDLRKFLAENRTSAKEETLNEVNFGKKEIVSSVSFPNGLNFEVGEYSNEYDLTVVAINPVPENKRQADEVVYVDMEEGDPDGDGIGGIGVSMPFNANGEEVDI